MRGICVYHIAYLSKLSIAFNNEKKGTNIFVNEKVLIPQYNDI